MYSLVVQRVRLSTFNEESQSTTIAKQLLLDYIYWPILNHQSGDASVDKYSNIITMITALKYEK